MRIAFDLDGVLFNFGQSCKDYLDATSRGHLWKSGPTPAPFWDWYKDWGWTSAEFVQFCNEGVDAGYIFRGNVRDNAVAAVWEVKTAGHNIIVATDRSFGTNPKASQDATIEWWKEYGFPDYDEIYFTADKTEANADIFVEDKLQNYDALMQAGVECWLINRPWNDVGPDQRNRIDDIIEFPSKVAARVDHHERLMKSIMTLEARRSNKV